MFFTFWPKLGGAFFIICKDYLLCVTDSLKPASWVLTPSPLFWIKESTFYSAYFDEGPNKAGGEYLD